MIKMPPLLRPAPLQAHFANCWANLWWGGSVLLIASPGALVDAKKALAGAMLPMGTTALICVQLPKPQTLIPHHSAGKAPE